MTTDKLSAIKERLAQSLEALTKEEIEWLVKRVEELQKENEWLKTELAYSEYQGETVG
jgi:phage host-nuclease inhibitor protein Gam